MNFRKDIPLDQFSTFKTGGKAEIFGEAYSIEDVKEAIQEAKNKRKGVFVLGGGSNVLIPDDDFNCIVLKMNIKGIEWRNINDEEFEVEIGAGENWDGLVEESVNKGLYRVENLSGIPGTVGAAPIQNIGAYGTELSDTLSSVKTIDVSCGKEKVFKKNECEFSYRNSIFKKYPGHFVITSIVLKLSRKGKANVNYKDIGNYISENNISSDELNPSILRDIVLSIRRGKFPDIKKYGTAGSFFKNPVIEKEEFDELKRKFPNIPGFKTESSRIKIPLAWILDNVLNLKGFREGNVGCFEKQPLVIVNFGGASSKEIKNFSELIKKRIKDETNIDVDNEVNVLSDK